MAIQPVHFALSEARHGWIQLAVSAGSHPAARSISCSHVFDPFQHLVALFQDAAWDGRPGTVEIDEEGHSTFVRIDVEPGQTVGRLRVFSPGRYGEVDESMLDARVDVLQVAEAWLLAFEPYAASYDPRHWTPNVQDEEAEVPARTLAAIRLDALKGALENRAARTSQDGGLPGPAAPPAAEGAVLEGLCYRLVINREQAGTIRRALDMWSRIGMGQLAEILEHPDLQSRMWSGSERPEKLRAALDSLKHDIFGLDAGAYHAIHSKLVHDDNRIAWDLLQVLRHRMAWDYAGNPPVRDWATMLAVDFDPPSRSSRLPLATIHHV